MQGWGDPSARSSFLGLAVVLLVAFVLWERRAKNPLLPLRVVLDRNRGGSYLIFLFVGAGLFAMFLFLTYYFQINLGYSPLQVRVRVPAVQRRDHRRRRASCRSCCRGSGPKPLMVVGLVLAVVGMLLLTQHHARHRPTGRTCCPR